MGDIAGGFMQFLKNVPDKWLMFLLFVFIYALYVWQQNDFSGQLLQTVVGGLMGVLIGTARSTQHSSTQSGDVIVKPDPPATDLTGVDMKVTDSEVTIVEDGKGADERKTDM
jgi:hypothetical protein